MLFPSLAYAGQVYGSLIAGGRGAVKVAIEITCAGAVTTGTTASDGSYRINVSRQGQCTFTLPGYEGRPSAVVFSYPKPTQYDFELVGKSGTYRLVRR
jgi:hypothetical protein